MTRRPRTARDAKRRLDALESTADQHDAPTLAKVIRDMRAAREMVQRDDYDPPDFNELTEEEIEEHRRRLQRTTELVRREESDP